MNKKSFPLAIGLILIIILSGCFQPIAEGEMTIFYNINNNGDITENVTITGIKGTDYNAWSSNCKQEIKKSIDEIIASYVLSMSSAETQEEINGFGSAINVLTVIKPKIECNIQEIDENNAKTNYGYTLKFEELQEISKLPNQTNPLNINKESGKISLNIPIIEETFTEPTGMNLTITEIRIATEGKIQTISPKEFQEIGNEHILEPTGTIGSISLTINTGEESNETPPPIDETTSNETTPAPLQIFGIDIIFIGTGLIILILLLIGILFFLKKKGAEETPFKKPKKTKPIEISPGKPISNKTIISKAMEKGLKKAKKEEKVEDYIIESKEMEQKTPKQEETLEESIEKHQKEIEEKTKKTEIEIIENTPKKEKNKEQQTSEEKQQESIEETEKEQKTQNSSKFSGEEQEDIEKLVKALMPKIDEFSKEDIKEAIIAQGFSEKVSKEVIKRLRL